MLRFVSFVLCLIFVPHVVFADAYGDKKILWIDAYHQGYSWSDGIEEGIASVIGQTNAEYKIHRMDTKRNADEAFVLQAADDAKQVIEAFQPDIVIGTDDNVSKYLIMPHYKDAELPFIFAGTNWSADDYGFPFSNVTGMVEVNAAGELIEILQSMAKGNRIGFLASSRITEKKDIKYTQKLFDFEFDARYVETFDEWKIAFKEMQDLYDIVVFQNNAGINNWNDDEAAAFARAHTKIPTGSFYPWMKKFVMIVYAKVPQEQGRYAAETALRVLDGERAGDIPIAQNQQGKVIINAKIAENKDYIVPTFILEAADEIFE